MSLSGTTLINWIGNNRTYYLQKNYVFEDKENSKPDLQDWLCRMRKAFAVKKAENEK